MASKTKSPMGVPAVPTESERGAAEAFDPTDTTKIPLAADGNPIFFILPPGVQASYDQRMLTCRQGWETTSDPAFAIEAYIYTHLFRQPPPLWVTEAVCSLAVRRRTKAYITRAFNAAIRWMRFEAVRDAKRTRTWEDAYEHAAESLAGTAARGKGTTMKTDYNRVMADLKAGRSGLYIPPKMPRGALGDRLKHKSPPRRRSAR
jgi:hypothetical protein